MIISVLWAYDSLAKRMKIFFYKKIFLLHQINDIIMLTKFFSFIYLQILTDLVQGEFMQLGAKETENERFTHYLTKTYRKTASLIANSLKSVSFSIIISCLLYEHKILLVFFL